MREIFSIGSLTSQIVKQCHERLKQINWLKESIIHVNDLVEPFSTEKRGLENVKHVIAVSSCKGRYSRMVLS